MTIYIALAILFGLSITVSGIKLFPKAKHDSWKALIPFLNIVVWLQIIKRPWWWIFLLLLPGVNFIMGIILHVEMVKAFNLRSATEQRLAGFLGFGYLPYIAFTKENLEYVGPEDWTGRKKTMAREWGEAIVFAVVAASIIRTYFLEAYTIPTSSMEKSMLIGDYLFVSKINYGPKVPQTPISFPFAHHTIPFVNVKSYLEWIKLPYYRIPSWGEVERNDVVVFNYPDGDTVVVAQQNQGYNQIIRNNALGYKINDLNAGKPLKNDSWYEKMAKQQIHNSEEITLRPVDKRENYIKRCVAIHGDKIEIKDGVLYVNDAVAEIPERSQYNYNITTNDFLNKQILKESSEVTYEDFENGTKSKTSYNIPLTSEYANKLKETNKAIVSIEPDFSPKDKLHSYFVGNPIISNHFIKEKDYQPMHQIFPNVKSYNWTEDNFGPLVIPEEGATIKLTLENLPLYATLITTYEHHDLEIKDGKILIDGKITSEYTFAMNYYWMMGDNRHNSADSRFWGFVPEDHIVGKALFIWMSLDKEKGLFDGKIRWNRLFSLVK